MNKNPICVDVKGFSVESKKHVQDLLFKLGYEWWFGTKHSKLEDNMLAYTNVYDHGGVSNYLLYSSSGLVSKQKQHLVTVEQLEQMVKEKEAEELKQNDEIFKYKGEVIAKLYSVSPPLNDETKINMDEIFAKVFEDSVTKVEEVRTKRKEASWKRIEQNDDQLTAAIKTLEHLGYTYHEGEMWKPPVGCSKYEQLVKIDFTKEEFWDLKEDLEAGVLYYKHKDEYFPIENKNNLLTCLSAFNYQGNVYRAVVLSKRDVMVKEIMKIIDETYEHYEGVCPENRLAERIVDSGLFEYKG